MTDPTTRSDYTAGLRRLADFLDKHPFVPLPYGSREPEHGLAIYLQQDKYDALEALDLANVAMRDVSFDFNDDTPLGFTLEGRFVGLRVHLTTYTEWVQDAPILRAEMA